ncbi:MAG: hypothetical protein QNJ15_02710 [Erythrobacter sp.]|nr:hypothetical protein [Erythrobacter sp.]
MFKLFGPSEEERAYESLKATHLVRLWNDGYNGANADQPNFLKNRIAQILSHSDYTKSLNFLKSKGHCGTLLNIFDVAANKVPAGELLAVARMLFGSFSNSGWELVIERQGDAFARCCLAPLSYRIPEGEISDLFTLLEDNNVLRMAAESMAPEYAAKTFTSLVRGRRESHKIARLKASPSWNSLDHKDHLLIEWIDSIDPEVLGALKTV